MTKLTPLKVEWVCQQVNKTKYYSYKANTLFMATEILRSLPGIPELTYYVVDTPDGSLGRDLNGFYTEKPLKINNIQLESNIEQIGLVKSVSLTDFGNGYNNQLSAATLKSRGQYASLVLLMECGRCAYKSPVETAKGEFERQCYACGAVNRTRRGAINVMTSSGFVEI
jgi:hypothetical protein